MRLVRRKSRKPEAIKLELEKIIGLTTCSANGLASNPATGDIVYLAGCVVVVYNVKTNCQTRFLTSPRNQKAFSCVAYSYCGGKHITAGETGHQPGVLVWEATTDTCVADLRSHKYGVSCVEFSPNGKYLVSVGVPHDGFLCLWDWRGGVLLIKTRSTAATLLTSSVHFSSDSSFFLTGGTKHLKQWSIGTQGQGGRARSAGGLGTVALEGRPVKLGSQMRSSFAAISCSIPIKDINGTTPDIQPLYALTTGGILCLLHCGMAVEKWVDLRVRQGYGMAVSETHVACACSDGIVRMFVQGSLAYAATMPRPAPYGFHGLTDGNTGMVLAVGQRLPPGIRFPDAIACQFLQGGQKLAVIYGDHSLFVWDIGDLSKIRKYRAFLSHSGCIWDVKTVPVVQSPSPDSQTTEKSVYEEAIATCSADGSIRLWNMDVKDETGLPVCPSPNMKPANIYSKELLGVLYLDPLAELKDRPSGGGSDDDVMDMSQGFRSICASPDGSHLAAGDRSGNLRIYDLQTMELISFQEAHDAEILTLSYTTVSDDMGAEENMESEPVSFLASGGRDRLIHIYDVNKDYDVIETLDDHSASITAVMFGCNGSKLLSCSADKSVVFRNIVSTDSGPKSIRYHQEVAQRGTIYDLDIDGTEKFAVTVGQDKKINVLNLASGKPARSFKPEGEGEPIKVQFDPSGAYMVCSHSDKCLRIYDFTSGELMAQASGHAEVITGVTFMPDCRRLISVSGDACIFVWKLPVSMSRAMKKHCVAHAEVQSVKKLPRTILSRSSKNPLRGLRLSKTIVPTLTDLSEKTPKPGTLNRKLGVESSPMSFDAQVQNLKGEEVICKEFAVEQRDGVEETPTFKFSVSRLPPWAQAKVGQEVKSVSAGKEGHQLLEKSPFKSSFESRWAERLGSGGYKLFSEFMEELTPPTTIQPSEFGTRRRFTVEGGASRVPINRSNTPDSVTSQQYGSSPKTSPPDPPRKEMHWKTVHTVFFDELDFSQDESPAKNCGLLSMTATHGNEESAEGPIQRNLCNKSAVTPGTLSRGSMTMEGLKQAKVREDEEDGVVVYLSDTDQETVVVETHRSQKCKFAEVKGDGAIVYCEQPSSGTPIILDACSPCKEEAELFAVARRQESGAAVGVSESCHASQSFSKSNHKTVQPRSEGGVSKFLSPSKSLLSDEDEDEDDKAGDHQPMSSPTDLFHSHFGELAVDVEVRSVPASTARRSFSSRFFAKASATLPRLSLFPSKSPSVLPTIVSQSSALLHDDELDSNPGRLLAAERERLKLRERQDKMAVEVQRMRERLVNLGIAVAEIAHDGEPLECRKDSGDDRESTYDLALPDTEFSNCMLSASPMLFQDLTNVLPTQMSISNSLSSACPHNVNSLPSSVFSFAQFCKLPSFHRKLPCVKEGLEKQGLKTDEGTAPTIPGDSITEDGSLDKDFMDERESGSNGPCKGGTQSVPHSSFKPSSFQNEHQSNSGALTPNNVSGSQPSAGLPELPLQSTSLSFLSLEDELSSGESSAATFKGNSQKEEIVEMTVTCTGVGWDYAPMKVPHEGGFGASSSSEISEQEVEQNGPSCPPSEATMDSPSSEPAMPIYLPRCKLGNPLEGYRNALQDLVEAADRAAMFLDQLRTMQTGQGMPDSLPGISSYDMDSTTHKLLPKAVEKVTNLVQETGALHTSVNAAPSVELSGKENLGISTNSMPGQYFFQTGAGNGRSIFSRPQTGSSIVSESLTSVDIDSFIDRYSTRFSQTLASQVLSLVQKGLHEAKS